MSLEEVSQRPSSASSKEHFYSSEREASSRLTARLERSVCRRSRGKHRVNYHDSSGSNRRRERHQNYSQSNNMENGNQDGQRENQPLREAPPCYDHRKDDSQQFYRKSATADIRKHGRPQSWYGAETPERKFKERPQSIHEISLDRNKQKNNFVSGSDYHNFSYDTRSSKSGYKSAGFRDRRSRRFELSRSLSSSFSSQVGSSADEGERDRHGVDSAYDMTERSPYGSLVLRRFSQSSLSSSSASWQQSTNSLSHHAVRGHGGSGQQGTDSPDKFHRHRDHQRQTVHKEVFLKQSPKIFEHISTTNATFISAAPVTQYSGHAIRVNAQPHRSHNSHVYVQATPYSSGHHVTTSVPNRSYNHNVSETADNFSQVYPSVTQVSSAPAQSPQNSWTRDDEDDGGQLSPSVKDLAKRFSGEFLPESFEELREMNDKERRRVKAQTWPKFAYVHSLKDRVARGERDHVQEVAPPKPPYPQSIVEDMAVMETTVESRNSRVEADDSLRPPEKSYTLTAHGQWCNMDGSVTADMLASHRLSLQELIKLHEDEIAKHANSAKATAHAQIYLKRPLNEKARNSQSPQTSPRELSRDENWGGSSPTSHKQFSVVNRVAESKPAASQYDSVERTPIKVFEVTDKGSTPSVNSEIRERSPVKAKRHRTIGVVGFRQQIDRISEEKAENKPKRHTAIGIVSVKAVETSERQLVKEETCVVSHTGYGMNKIPEKGLENMDSEQRNNNDVLNQDSRQTVTSMRVKKRKAFDRTGRTVPEDEDIHDEVFERTETSIQVVRAEEVVQVRPESEHSRERKTARSDELTKGEGLTRIAVASLEKPGQPVEPISTQATNLRTDGRMWNVPVSGHAHNYPKPYAISKAVPVAQVSPVSPALELSSRATLTKDNFTEPLPLSKSQSAREMYETRLALWNLYPLDSSPAIHSSETSGNTPLDEKIGVETERNNLGSIKPLDAPENRMMYANETKIEPSGFARPNLEEYYLNFIEKLKHENKDLIAKHEVERRELRQKYEEQRKVANAYQKLEDRYRRRVHELQEALAGCTCQSPFVNHNHDKVPQSVTTRSDKDGDRSMKGLKTLDDLEDWSSENSKDNSASRKNNNTESRNSLISSSSDMTGTASAWDELYDRLRATGEIDAENGTHV